MLQASTMIAGLALWCVGANLKRREELRPWISLTILAVGGYAIVMGLALSLRTMLTA